MKKSIYLLGLCATALISCKKDYSCTCTATSVLMGETEISTSVSTIEGATKTQAQAACNEATIKHVEGSFSTTEKCNLSK